MNARGLFSYVKLKDKVFQKTRINNSLFSRSFDFKTTAPRRNFSRTLLAASSHKQTLHKATKVLYDGDCKICAIEIAGLKRLTRNSDKVSFVDISAPSYSAEGHGGVTYEQAMEEMHVIDSEGKVLTQGDAIRAMYRASGLGPLAALTELPGIRQACDRLYMRFAKYRLKKALARCDDDRCSVKLRQLQQRHRE